MQNLITNQLNYTQLRPLVRSKNKNSKKYTQARAGYASTFPERRVEREREREREHFYFAFWG